MEEKDVVVRKERKRTYIAFGNASGVINRGRTFVHSITFSYEAADGTFKLRNGVSVTDDIYFSIAFTQQLPGCFVFKDPIEFDRGLYLEMVTNTPYVTIQYSIGDLGK